jgi:hypothetical protein
VAGLVASDQQHRVARRVEAARCLPSGPYHQWTRKIGGKTVTRILTDDQLADYQPWFDNQRRLRDLITEMETLSQEIADADPRWDR